MSQEEKQDALESLGVDTSGMSPEDMDYELMMCAEEES